MLGEIPYMIVWGFFSAMGWMGANYTMEKAFPDKEKQAVEQKAKDEQSRRSNDTSRRAGEPADSGNNSGSESSRSTDLPGGKS